MPGSCQQSILNLVNNGMGGPNGVYVFRVDGEVEAPGTVTLTKVTNTMVYTKPTDPPTKGTTESRFDVHLKNLKHSLNRTNNKLLDLCPYLLERPTLQVSFYLLKIFEISNIQYL